ncbi:MAG: hypothetical protein WC156_16410, partial [Pedobacter sp.]
MSTGGGTSLVADGHDTPQPILMVILRSRCSGSDNRIIRIWPMGVKRRRRCPVCVFAVDVRAIVQEIGGCTTNGFLYPPPLVVVGVALGA